MNVMKTLRPVQSFIAVLKPRASIILSAYTLTGLMSYILVSFEFHISQLIKLFFAVTSIAYSIYLYNDLADFEDDMKYIKLGEPAAAKRPLGKGLVSKREMKIFITFVTIVGLTTSLLINIHVFLSQLGFLALGLAYSTEPIRLKKRFILKQITIALGGTLVILTGGFAAGVISGKLIFLMFISFLMYLTIPSLTDLRDLKWDREVGIKSFPVVWGPGMTVRLMLAILMVNICGVMVGYLRLGFNLVLPILGSIILISFIYVLYPLLEKWNDEKYINKVTNRVFILWFMLLVVILVGSYPR